MMFAQEMPLHSALQRSEERLTRSPNSPINFSSPQPQDLSISTSPSDMIIDGIDCPSPLKAELGYFPSSSILKLEPLSPPHSFTMATTEYSGKGKYRGRDWQAGSPDDSESLSPYSPVSNGITLASASSPLTSPLSNCSTTTSSPTTKLGREDLSPVSSINGYNIEYEKERKKKGSSNRQTEELCLVCGDRSSGYHYNALTCEGCKGFFRRSITKNAVYVCKYGNHCEMDMYMRRKCQECRFKKCISVGMRPDCVVPETQCKQKRDQKKNRDKDKNKDPTRQINNVPITVMHNPKFRGITLTKEHQELINRLVYNQERYEAPNPIALENVHQNIKKKAQFLVDERYEVIMEMTRFAVELIVEFARNAPGFDSLIKEDQVTLLKACTSEIIALKASRKYHIETDSIIFADNTPVTKDFYNSVKFGESMTEAIFSFCRKLAVMKVDNAEYALLTGISIFSERPGLHHLETVEKIQYLYVETLLAYVHNKGYPEPVLKFAKLLDVLTQLRSMGVINNEQCEKFLNNERDLPELLSEIWDIKR